MSALRFYFIHTVDRHFAAWLGLTPKPHSRDGKERLRSRARRVWRRAAWAAIRMRLIWRRFHGWRLAR
ncbi:transposase [Mesorhizobium sp. M1A.F.Ca.ET.072.01.1.1]|uniref:transposase n=1 Tax=Mesorhizobium sp. M1A.F.Ca.ET.072.01.1.1 TaxID=2496753 RepID=UPI001FE00EF2|nr:transposase [Mesorhizobium sp. M1A.F.Ca.ET.072.01.1.1]